MNRRTQARPCQSALPPSSKLDTALALHDQGFWIAICDGKRPIHANWPNKRLSKKEIPTMLEKQPDANIAIVLGRSPVIDIECDSPEAEKALCGLFKEVGAKLPDTPTYRSKRGNHRLFQRPRGLPDAAVVAIQGIEFRLGANGKGATSTIPPSVHPDGPKYRWLPGRSIFEIPPASLPKEIVRRLHEAERGLSDTEAQPIRNGQLVARGNRSSYLARIAGAMRRHGLKADEMLPALEAVNANRCDPVLPRSELVGIAESIGRYPPTYPMLSSLSSLNSRGTPELPQAAYHGLAGDILNAIDQYTEAAPGALLAHVLVAFGVRIGCQPHFMVQHDRHVARVNALVVGQTAKGRKGTSWGTPRVLFDQTEKDWTKEHVVSGLSSGEGLVNRVRDLPIDMGFKDCLVIEPEFATTLTVINREGNTLSGIIRQAWDGGDLSVLTRNTPLTATDANIGIVGHITQEELSRCLSETQKANGFGNRFLYFLVSRSKVLPDGATPPDTLIRTLAKDLKCAVQFARKAGRLKRDDEAKELWHAKYESLSEGRPGMLGAILSRAEAQVLRLSLIYALLDRSTTVKRTHLEAALAVWDFCERSAQIIFGDSTGDEIADRIYDFLRHGPKTETEISNYLGRHVNSDRIKSALAKLEAIQRIEPTRTKTAGRPKTVWARSAQKAKNAKKGK